MRTQHRGLFCVQAMASRQSGYDRHITIFSPEGRLYQVEYAFKAVKGCGLTSIGLRGKDSVVMVTQKKVPDKLMDPSYVTHLYNVQPSVGLCCTGMTSDGRALVGKAREIASKFKDEMDYTIPCDYLAHKVANIGQVYTQHAFMRPYGIVAMFCAIDEEKGPQLYKVDPAGHFMGYKAACAGAKEQEGSNALEKVVKKGSDEMDTKTVIQEAIGTLQSILAVDFKSADIEVGLVTADNPTFRRLTDAEVDDHLTAIAEKD